MTDLVMSLGSIQSTSRYKLCLIDRNGISRIYNFAHPLHFLHYLKRNAFKDGIGRKAKASAQPMIFGLLTSPMLKNLIMIQGKYAR